MCISHPVVHVNTVPADIVLEFLALAALELVQLFQIIEALGGGLQALFLPLEGFAKDLLSTIGALLALWTFGGAVGSLT